MLVCVHFYSSRHNNIENFYSVRPNSISINDRHRNQNRVSILGQGQNEKGDEKEYIGCAGEQAVGLGGFEEGLTTVESRLNQTKTKILEQNQTRAEETKPSKQTQAHSSKPSVPSGFNYLKLNQIHSVKCFIISFCSVLLFEKNGNRKEGKKERTKDVDERHSLMQ